jgi:hypothetical protein
MFSVFGEVRLPTNGSQSGIGLPHSKTSRKELRIIRRASVLECGSPMPLSLLLSAQATSFLGPMPLHLGVAPLLTSAATPEIES